jgi:hypothetical protein
MHQKRGASGRVTRKRVHLDVSTMRINLGAILNCFCHDRPDAYLFSTSADEVGVGFDGVDFGVRECNCSTGVIIMSVGQKNNA